MAGSKLDKDAYAILSQYIKLYSSKYGTNPIVNKYKEKWAVQSLIDDFGIDEVNQIMQYYFKLPKDGHTLNWFYNNFSSLYTSKKSIDSDNIVRANARKKTQELRAEYLNGLS